MQWKRYIPDSQENALIALLAFVSAVFGAKEWLGLFITDDRAKYVLFAVVIVAIGRYALRKYETSRLPSLPTTPGVFNPFRLTTASSKARLWRRNDEEKALLSRLGEATHAHLVVTGPSGAGKSTLVFDLVKPALEKDGRRVRFFSSYSSFVIELIEGFEGTSEILIRQRQLASQYHRFMEGHRCSVRDVFDPAHRSLDAEALWEDVARYLTEVIPQETTTVFIFDQIERLVHLLRMDSIRQSSAINGYEVYFFIFLLKYLRQSPQVRTLFVIRAEYLYQSFDFLEHGASPKDGGGANAVVVHFLCPGINTMSAAGAVTAIREDFKSIASVSSFAQAFEHINGLDSREFSNTFLTQLCGYVIENFHKSDPRVMEFLRGRGDRISAVHYFFEYMLNDYLRQNPTSDAMEMIKTVLFTIAAENRIAGHAITSARICALSHLPLDETKDIVGYLCNTGIIGEEGSDQVTAYRMVHDIMSDYAIENEQFAIDTTLKDCIRGLVESGVRTDALIKVAPFADPLKDWAVQPNIGLVAVWTLYVYGALQTLFPTVCEAGSHLLRGVFAARECSFVNKFYFSIYLMQIIWVSFIYYLDRGYFRYVLRSALPRYLSATMPVTGTILAILLSQSPALFLFPVVFVGCTMGAILIMGTLDGSFVGRTATLNRRWGIRTIFNMLFASLFMLITGPILSANPTSQVLVDNAASYLTSLAAPSLHLTADDIRSIWMYGVNGIMIYFWWHIKPEQQSRVSLTSRLAVNDRTWFEATKS